jgi:SAM-dependent methyltransferase
MDDEARFAADLYRGTAGYYDRYRLPYPAAMIEDLARRARSSGRGRLLDLACGTGQLAFPLRRWFGEVWAVDAEPDMTELVRARASAAGDAGIRAVTARAETFRAERGTFELAVIGNAFHRLDRDLVAGRIAGWLEPGGHLALCWSSSPWTGPEGWQRALAAFLDRWRAALGAGDRVPAGWDLGRQRHPDAQVLSAAGFESAGRREFAAGHRWSLPELAGHIRSTSFLPAAVLGAQSAAFDAGLAAALGPLGDHGAFTETVSFAYELARKTASLTDR